MRHIIHADLDAFYAAVEQLDNPQLRGLPVMVGGSPQSRGVVATASYEARAFGVHSAMPMVTAVRQCPQGIVVRPRFDRYREMSRKVMDIFHQLTALVEPLSLDEAYLDITAVVEAGRLPLGVAIDLKRRVREETGLNVSIGVGACKSVAKIASDLEKPDGLVVVAPGDERDFLEPLPVGKLWGIGPKTAERLHRDGVETIGDLANQPDEWYARRFGKRAQGIRAKALGQDDDPVKTERNPKSISAETTFAEDLSEPEDLRQVIGKLSASVSGQLTRKEVRGRTVTVKLRLADFTTLTRQTTLPDYTNSEAAIVETAWQLLTGEMTGGRAFRLLGVGVSGFGENSPGPHQLALPLFGRPTDA
ncbi:MAG: DNA polymerase IV [Chloroflexota bacterium]|nr:DNA polymerase IV [Chloroflexota bacterium]